MKQFTLILVILVFWQELLICQTCSFEQLQAKYWQYRENFNKHFVAIDRDSTGCVHVGIGFDSAASTETPVRCLFSNQGMSLPATSINIGKDGSGAIHSRNGGYGEAEAQPMKNAACGGHITWNELRGPNDPPKYNWLDVGSETLTQMGWYLVILSTEYELLYRNGQIEDANKTMGEVFLALQAIRRLDMQAQCMVKVMYDDRKCTGLDICEAKYKRNVGPLGQNGYCANCNIDVNCDCNFIPDYSGYSGFLLRSDATQGLEQLLHDPTDPTYNIDAVGGTFAISQTPPCDTAIDNADVFCSMMWGGWFCSKDQIAGLLWGLSFVSMYIPESATVTTCEGEIFKPYEMAGKIADGIVKHIGSILNRNWIAIKVQHDTTRKLSVRSDSNACLC